METIATNTLPLSDGRLLEYASYGDARGFPAVFFHGFIGSHHQAAFAHEAARRHGLRFIAPNRPGVGRSTPKDRRSLEECVPDVAQLADALGLTRFAVIGVSGGVAYALACLKGLPRRVPVGVLVSGLGPVGEPGPAGGDGIVAPAGAAAHEPANAVAGSLVLRCARCAAFATIPRRSCRVWCGRGRTRIRNCSPGRRCGVSF